MVFMSLLVSFSFQGSRGLYETSEGRYAECAREMIENGNYIEPALGYRPHWTKPPFTYWTIAGGIRLLGRNEWGVRLYNAIAFILATLMVAYLGSTLWDRTTGIIAGLIYLSSPFPMFACNMVTTDCLLALWEVSSVLCYFKAYRAASPRRREQWVSTMWLFFGLGFLTKGPPALLPLIPILIWHFQKKPPIRLLNRLGMFLFILIGFSWYLVVCFLHPELVSYFLGHEVVDRIAYVSNRNPEWYKPFIIYLPILTFGAGPWLYMGLKILRRKHLLHPMALWSYARRGDTSSFLLLWLFLPLIIFFLVKSRLPLYVLPYYAPVALAIARGIYRKERDSKMPGRVAVIALISGIVLLGVKGIASFCPHKNNMKTLYQMCQKAGGDSAKVVVFNQPKLFGLQYYLDGHLERVSFTGKEPWSDGSARDVFRKRDEMTWSKPCVLISGRKDSSELKKILRGSDVGFKQVDNKYWVLFLMKKYKSHGLVYSRISRVTKVF